MVELLAKYLARNEAIPLAKMGPLKPFEGLSNEEDELYKHVNSLGLLKRYVVAAKKKSWDHIGEVFLEQGLVGPGQNPTPKPVVDMIVKMTMPEKITQIQTILDPCVGSGRFLIEASLLNPEAPLILFGIEINLSLYRACLVNMALFSNHPYSIVCADALRLIPEMTGPASRIWDLGNRWDPPDVSTYYYKPPPPPKPFSLKDYVKEREEDPDLFLG